MFKHILIPTDGSAASAKAIHVGVQFAKLMQADITGLHVIPEYHIFSFQAETLDETREKFMHNSVAHAQAYLAEIASAAREAGVQCETTYLISDYPYLSIIALAKDKKCDLIAMASHGRKGIKALLPGSETQKLLTHCTIPVLVFHAGEEIASPNMSS